MDDSFDVDKCGSDEFDDSRFIVGYVDMPRTQQRSM